MMKHRKTNHIDSVQICKNDKTCQYRSKSCWFKHTDIKNGNMEIWKKTSVNQEMTSNILKTKAKLFKNLLKWLKNIQKEF